MYRVQLQPREMQYDDGDTTSTTILQLELQVLYQDVCFEGDTISKDRIVAPCQLVYRVDIMYRVSLRPFPAFSAQMAGENSLRCKNVVYRIDDHFLIDGGSSSF